MTFFSVFDVPVFWPILLLYWLVLVFVTMKRQIRHMIKHRYGRWGVACGLAAFKEEEVGVCARP